YETGSDHASRAGDSGQPLGPRRQGRGGSEQFARRCGMTRVAASFAKARSENRAAFVGYLTAGYPDDEAFLAAATTVLAHADILEIGLPFSDPLGDGPTIQRAGEAALARGVDGRRTIELLGRLRQASDKPLLVMS